MDTKHYLVGLILLIEGTLPLFAEEVDVASAQKKAVQFFNSVSTDGRRRAPALNSKAPQMVFAGTKTTVSKGITETENTRARAASANQDSPYFYVFNSSDSDGFVIISGEDAADPVIGYSHSSTFNPDDIPDGLQYMLGRYAAQIEYLRTSGIRKVINRAPEEGTIIVDKLLTTTWGQWYPYNSKVHGLPAGCVNTAMAQILNYYQYPKSIKNESPTSINYYRGGNYPYAAIPVEGSTGIYDYSSFKDSYGDMTTVNSSEAEKIGSFFLDISTSLAYTNTGTSSLAGLPGLTEYYNEVLGYDPFGYFYLIENATQYEEIGHQILCKELDNGRPIFTANRNHAFVIDGYAGDGSFHVNWGWNGNSDGWFKIYVSNDVGYLEDGAIVTYIGFAPPADKVHPIIREYEKGLVDCDITEALVSGSQQTFESKFTVTDVEYGVDSVGLAIMEGSKISRIISKSVPIDTYVQYMTLVYNSVNGYGETATNYVAGYKDMKGLKTVFYVPDNNTSDVITYNLAMVYLSEGTWRLPNKYPGSLSDELVIVEPLTIKVAPKGVFSMKYGVGRMTSMSLDPEEDEFAYETDTILVNGSFQPVYTHTLSNCRNVKVKFNLLNEEQGVPFHGDVKFEMVRHEDQKTVFSTILEDAYVSTRPGMNSKEFDLTIDNLPPGTYFPRAEGKIYIRKDGEHAFEQLTEFDHVLYHSIETWEGYRVVDSEEAETVASPYITKYWWTTDDGIEWDINNYEWGGHPEGIGSGLKHYLYPKCQSGYNVTVCNPSSEPKRIALLFTNFPGTDSLYHPATDTLQFVEKTLAPKESYTYINKFESKQPGDQLYLHAEYQGLDENLQWFKPGVYELMARAHSGSDEEEVYKGKAHVMYLADLEKGQRKSLQYLDMDRYTRGGAYRFYADTVAAKYYEKFPSFKLYGFQWTRLLESGMYETLLVDSLSFNYKDPNLYTINGYDENIPPHLEYNIRFKDDLGSEIIPPVDSIITEIYDADKKLLYTTRVGASSYRGVIWDSTCNVPRPKGNLYFKSYFKVLEHVYPIVGDREFFPLTIVDSVRIGEYGFVKDKMYVAGEMYDLDADDNVLVRGATTDLKYCFKNMSPDYTFNGTIAIYCGEDHAGEVIDLGTNLSGDIPISIKPFATTYGTIPVTIPANFDENTPKVDLYLLVADEAGNQTRISSGQGNIHTFDVPVVDNQVIVSVLPSEREYGEATVPEIRVSGGCTGKTFEWTTPPTIECTAGADSPAGIYDVYVSGGSGNIPIAEYRGNIMKIKPAKASIKPRDVTRETGEDNPALTYDITGLKNGDTEEVLLFKPELVCEATSDSKSGTYPITIKNAVKAVNYDFTVEEGVMTIEEPADPGIAQLVVGNYSREYGDDNPAIQIALIPQVTAIDTVDVYGIHHYATVSSCEPEWEEMPTVTVDATKTSVPGDYPISVTGGKLKGYEGYEIIEPGVLTVKKANLQVIARDTTLHYRSFWKPEYFEYIGFKNGEDVSVLDNAPIPDYYHLLDDNSRIVGLVHNQIYMPTGGEDDCYQFVYPQQEEYSSLRWEYGYLNVVPDTIQLSTGPLLTITYGDEGPLVPNETTYDQFPTQELPEGYGVYRVMTKNGASWGLMPVGRLDAGDHLLQSDTLFVCIGLDTEEARNAYDLGDAGYVAFYIPTLKIKPAELYARTEATSWTTKITCFNMHDEYKFTYSGFRWDDDESAITQKPTWKLANGELPLPGYHQLELDQEGIAKNYTFTYSLSTVAINQATPADYFSRFNSAYSGQYECELKWKDDMEFQNTYVGGTDVVKIEDYGIFECIDSIFPGRYDEYWETNGRMSKLYDYIKGFTVNYDSDKKESSVTYTAKGDLSLRLRLNLPEELFSGNVTITAKDVSVSEVIVKGDVNGDMEVDVADVVYIVNGILGKPAADYNEEAADVNGDGVVDVADVVEAVNIILKKDK